MVSSPACETYPPQVSKPPWFWTHLIECSPSTQELWVSSLALQKLGVVAQACNSSPQEVEGRRWEVQSHPWLHSSIRPAWATWEPISKEKKRSKQGTVIPALKDETGLLQVRHHFRLHSEYKICHGCLVRPCLKRQKLVKLQRNKDSKQGWKQALIKWGSCEDEVQDWPWGPWRINVQWLNKESSLCSSFQLQ